MYQVIANQGLGFTEVKKEFSTIKQAVKFALNFDNVKIYKNKKRVF